ncbi:hypothetical protein [Arthrobacter cavernae]|uniref:Uncharacterized protein n=1 Tax=Arthrobacter cavernae TaxID=2817681 RepID=A0A939HA76_9MICC|nr:hypothetical protein [Arthrobacter cavernae]MBO1267084.1 hypothetical protein [Arthrobacter cavernae]
MSDYDSLQITQDAVAFAKSKFGKHYLKRLEKAKARYLELTMNEELTDNFRAHAGTKAATVQLEIDYFMTAQTVADTPTFMKRLRDKINARREKEKL